MPRRSFALAAAGLLAFGAGACAAEPGDDDTLQVVAAFYPLEYLASRVGGEHVSVSGLAPPGVEAHDLELTPSQVAEISQADLVIFLADFQPAVDAAVREHAGDRALDIAELVPLLTTDHHPHDHEDDDDHGHDDEDDHHEDEDDHDHDGEGEGGQDDGHDHGGRDPHVWLDPERFATIAAGLATQLGQLDQDNADAFAGNAASLDDELSALDLEYAQGLAQCQRREIVVSHAAFGYLADRYDLHQIAITGLSPEDEPTPQRLAEVIRQADAYGATTIYFEVLVSPAVAEVIADEVGAQTAVLDPIEGLAPDRDEDYFSLMRSNLDTLRDGLDCQ